MYAHTVVDGYYAGVGDYSPFVLTLPITFRGLNSSVEPFFTEFAAMSMVNLHSSALSVMNGQLLADDDTAYSDYVLQAVLNAMNVIRLKNSASVDMSNGVRDWEWIEG